MKTKQRGILTLLLAFIVHLTFAQQKTISGIVSDQDGIPLPGVNILVKGTQTGTQTGFDGEYSISASKGQVLLFTYLGQKSSSRTIGDENTINVQMEEDAEALQEVVVTALGIKREERTLTYASQEVKGENLNITEDVNIKSAIAGKVAGVQIQGQSGSKLGQSGKIRIRGGISLTSDSDPLYVIDGTPTTDPNSVDMGNVESLNVLKGPNATALYGQRAASGVVVITTKRGKKGQGLGVEISSSITFDNVAYLPNYQNMYGQGYSGESEFSTFDYAGGNRLNGAAYPTWMQVFDGKRYFAGDAYADESWGPKFDGQGHVPWYNYYPDSPTFGEEVPYVGQPDNIKDAFDTGISQKNSISLSGSGDNYRARIAYTNIKQNGIVPNSDFTKNFISTSLDFDLSDKLTAGVNINYTVDNISGDFDDGYGNQTSGSLNSWFNRNLDMNKVREFKDLKTPRGFATSWNNWGLDYFAYAEEAYERTGNEVLLQYQKPAFWFNQFSYLEQYEATNSTHRLLGDIHFSYQLTENLDISAKASRNERKYKRDFFVPYSLEFAAAPDLYNPWVNSFGKDYITSTEDNYNILLKYTKDFGKIDLTAFVGGNILKDNYYRFQNDMATDNFQNGGLILPDVYTYSNSREVLTAYTYESEKQVNSIYGNMSLGYDNMAYLDVSVRRDWSSSLPSGNNGYTYPSIGGSFILSELWDNKGAVTFAKLRGSWAQVGDDVNALALNPTYPLGSNLYNGQILMYTPTQLVSDGIEPAINTSQEIGVDLKFIENRIGLSATYYTENRKNEIIPVSLSTGTGYSTLLTNAGESERKGIELTLNADIIRTEDFNWSITANYAKNSSKIISLPGDLKAINGAGGSDAYGFVNVVHELGGEWGQLRGTGYKLDDAGNRVINSDGLYVVETDQYFGSILPDFTGGLLTNFSYKNISLAASFDFQKGGKFFSLSEMWGTYSGLLDDTVELNDNGVNQRDAIADGGGVHVTGVEADGTPVDTYVEAQTYWNQFQPNRLATPFIHDADYIKLRDLSLTYSLPNKLLEKTALQSVSISAVGRNLWLISVADNNKHGWDPSELSQSYGENAQLPGTRSYGLNLKLTF
ncbi:SusC/RagA family TonB-linked outer membrane protein [Cellulophaga fucicola]|uniref:TonB-linked outer membrane protein, SusC/RagA family n=1 Tax=Cellulophaga fucicola TaxID=76595 RepID=A0A1K1P206_9FLAO|nr:SusC/RagA family TonB-linked outer membrane protein [Cellulophaga fucicola]SFW41493.1 TonB-linked outer membrane protein, SusC/RagA family [Cellulophaga fucicola]